MGRGGAKGCISIPSNVEELLDDTPWQALPKIKYLIQVTRFLRRLMLPESVFVVHNCNDARKGMATLN